MTNGEKPIVGKPVKRKQHYLPQFFIRGFADDDGKLCFLHRINGSKIELEKNRTPKTFCFKKDLYEAKARSGDNESFFPNGIEDAMASMESSLKELLDPVIADLRKLSSGVPLTEKRIGEIADVLAFTLSWFTYRRPEEVEKRQSEAPLFLNAMRENGLGTAESLRKLYIEATGCESAISDKLFDPEIVSRYAAKCLDLAPPLDVDEEIMRNTSLSKLADYLRHCSIVALVAVGDNPFVGLDFPTNVEIAPGVGAHYWPISKEVAVLYFDDGQHIFKCLSFGKSEVDEINGFGILNGSWDYAFCGEDAGLGRFKSRLEGKDEQD